jgi:hypothetical protein
MARRDRFLKTLLDTDATDATDSRGQIFEKSLPFNASHVQIGFFFTV